MQILTEKSLTKKRSTKKSLTKNRLPRRAHWELPRPRECHANRLSFLLLAATLAMTFVLSACGGSSNPPASQQSAGISGNWQFTVFQNPDSNYPPGQPYGLQGGFLLQTNDSVTGQAVYSVSNFTQGSPQVCNAGSATLTTATVSAQTVGLTYVAGSQTFSLTGTLSSNGSTMSGTYTATQGTASDGVTVCGIGTGASGPEQWTAILVPALSGTIQGSFHSTNTAGLGNQDFPVSGSITQGENIGASNATVTGTLSFINPETTLSAYPCFSTASVTGEISGDSVVLQIIGTNGSVIGQIGEPSSLFQTTAVNPVTFNSAQGGYVLQGLSPTYMVATSACPGSLADVTVAGDSGNICLALNSTTACQQPLTLTPASIIFPAQTLSTATTAATTQTITLTNVSGQELDNLTLSQLQDTSPFAGQSDFTGLPDYTFTDTCGSGNALQNQQPFNLGGTFPLSCVITVQYDPQEGCAWLPSVVPPAKCPSPLQATVTVTSPSSADPDLSFAVPISGIGLSAVQPSTPELDFGAEQQPTLSGTGGEASLPQMLQFTNYSPNPVQILGYTPCQNPPNNEPKVLPRPLTLASPVSGLQVVANYSGIPTINADNTTISYGCDNDPGTLLPNFQISGDTCTGTLLTSQASCSLQIAFVPQPKTDVASGLDAFLELNTVECPGLNCEIDSGRFPVELTANPPSPLRMSPSAGLDFGTQKHGTTSAPMTITLLNDPTVANPQTVTFEGRILVSGNFSESDNCPAALAPGSNCILSLTFTPGGVGFESEKVTINYSPLQNASFEQFIYLRGTGQ